MKVKELLQIIEASAEHKDHFAQLLESEVVIEYTPPGNTVGSIPCVSVDGAFFGFDWDSGRFIITPNQPLMVKVEDKRTHYWHHMFCNGDHRKPIGDDPCNCLTWIQNGVKPEGIANIVIELSRLEDMMVGDQNLNDKSTLQQMVNRIERARQEVLKIMNMAIKLRDAK